MGRNHSHRPSAQKVAQRKRQAAYGSAYRARKRQEQERARAEREAAEQEALYADPAPPTPPAPPEPELIRCGNCNTERPASEFSAAAAARVRKGGTAWCQHCHEVRLSLLVRPGRVRRHGSRDA